MADDLHFSVKMDSNQDFLVKGLKEGNQMVFEEIFNSFYEPLVRYCMQRVYRQEDAEEIVQDIFIKLWVKRKELNYNPSLKSYLYRTALNRVINHQEHLKVRSTHRDHVLSSQIAINHESGAVMEKEIQWLAAEAVNSMPKKRRQVYEFSRRDGMTYAEIAEKMGISIKTVEAHLTAALEQLRTHLKDYLPVVLLLASLFY